MEFFAEYFGFLNSPAGWAALITLLVMEIVLGIDNLIFISILTNKLPEHQQTKARYRYWRCTDPASRPAFHDFHHCTDERSGD